MNASKASLFCLLLCACSSDSGGNPSGAGGLAGMLTNSGGGGVGQQPGAGTTGTPAGGTGTNPPPGSGGIPMQGVGGNVVNPGSGGLGGSLPGAGGASGGSPGIGGAAGSAGGVPPATGGSTSAGGAAGSTGSATKGCDATTLLAAPNPADPSARGAWPVGEKTLSVTRAGGVTEKVEVLYPAQVGSDAGKQVMTYDLRTWLPDSQRSKVADKDSSAVNAGTYADLPLDASHGPYPVIILVHGTGAFRVASWTSQATWASHGFVVLAADHPNLYLTDYLNNGCGMPPPALDLSGDVDAEIAAVKGATGDWAFLSGHLDTSRIGLAGHSAGAFNVAQFTNKPGVQVVIPLSGTHVVNPSSSLKSVAFIGGMNDTVLPYATGSGVGSLLYPGTQLAAYQGSPGAPVKKRLLGITGGGHLCVTDLCVVNSSGKNPLQVAQAAGVCGLGILPSLFDCGTVDRLQGIKAVDDLSTAVFQETLQCQDLASVISGTKTRNSVVGDFQEAK